MPFCIAGMHRTGTSMVSHMLSMCGAYLGPREDLLGEASPSNPEGHWENVAFRHINDSLLGFLGGGWDYPPDFPDQWAERAADGPLGEMAHQLVDKHANIGVWGWKDPRNSLLLPFWKNIIPGLKTVVCVRSPLDVAASLSARAYTSDVLAIELWTTYYQRLQPYLSAAENIVTHYDSYFPGSELELRRVASFVGLSPSDELLTEASAAASHTLRHHRAGDPALDFKSVLPAQSATLYEDLCRAAGLRTTPSFGDETSPPGPSRPETVGRLAAGRSPRTGPVASMLVEKEAQLGAARDSLKQMGLERALRNQEIEQLKTQVTAQARMLVDLEATRNKVDHLARTVANREQELSEVKQEWAGLRSELDTIYASTGLRFLQTFWGVRDALFPPGSFRRSVYNVPMGALRALAGMGKDAFWLAARDLKETPRGNPPVGSPAASAVKPAAPDDRGALANQAYEQMLSAAANKSQQDFVPMTAEDLRLDPSSPKLVAFYLPQYHPIPENDAWWGKGFTEWSNVSKAVPQFVGHYQPRLPGELGFYDLRVLDVQKRQIELARKYGIYGFCFHYYWFAGKRLLERPLDQFLQHSELDLPFCLCWANENWTRRWDGADHEVLIAQEHSPQSDAQFIEDVIPVLRDGRYIHVGERPLLVVYRPDILPDVLQTVRIWRQHCLDAGIGDPYLVAAQTFGLTDPRPLGFDAAVQFPPHNTRPRPIRGEVQLLNPGYRGNVHDYEELVDRITHARDDPPPYDLFWTVFPGWDNEARTPGAGRTFVNTSPETYKEWLIYAAERTLGKPEPEKQIVFINAWNEWAEGAYLEPDRRYGYAYLQATADALRAVQAAGSLAPQAEVLEALIATIPRAGTLMMVTFFKMYDYLLTQAEPEATSEVELFRRYDDSHFLNIGFSALHIGHGYCPGYAEFGDGPVKDKWQAIEASPHWFDEAGEWIRENRDFLYPHLNPKARIVFVYRNPFDFVVSMYTHFEDHKDRPEGPPMPLDAFIDMVVPQYLKVYVSYIEGRARYPACFHLVSYESMMEDREGELRSVLNFLGRPVRAQQEAAFRSALHHTEPPVMRRLELFMGATLARDQRSGPELSSHMRGGAVGRYREALLPHQVGRIIEHLHEFDLGPEDFGVHIPEASNPTKGDQILRRSPGEIYATFHGLSDDEWIEMVVNSPERPAPRGVRLPGLPNADLQRNLVGTSGVDTLRDGARFYREIKQYCDSLVLGLGLQSRILDFGCGFGRHIRFFLKDVPADRLVGLDVSQAATEACRATLPMCTFEHIGPWPPTVYPDASFDLIYSYSVFSHLNQGIADAWVQEFSRLLRPRGALIITSHHRSLIDYAARLRKKSQYGHRWEERVARAAFLDGSAAHQQYERGEFLYARTGDGTGAFDPELYGNTILSPGYVRTHWLSDFNLVAFVDDSSRLVQAIIVLSRK